MYGAPPFKGERRVRKLCAAEAMRGRACASAEDPVSLRSFAQAVGSYMEATLKVLSFEAVGSVCRSLSAKRTPPVGYHSGMSDVVEKGSLYKLT